MKQITRLLISICIAFSISGSVSAQGGTSFETAVQATFDTNNIADASVKDQYYYFIPDFNGYVAIGNCGLTKLETEVVVYDSLEYQIDANYYFCDFQTHLVIPVDSSMRYYIRWTLFENTEQPTYNWYLTEYYPEPGEFYALAIPVEINDTVELLPINNSMETWYKLEADKNKMITVSTCGFGNTINDILLLSAYKNVVNMDTPDWVVWDNNCSDDKYLEFPADSGSLYYLGFDHKYDMNTAKWTISERDFMAGEICDSGIQVDKGVEYVVPSEKNGYWYKYTPAENEYKVIGSVQGKEQYAGLFIKEDCGCEPEYFVTSGCIASVQDGIALLLEAGKTYYIGWNNYEYIDITWSIYDPTDIVYFTVESQFGATEIDHINHTVNITVAKNTSVTNLTQYFIKAEGIDYIANGEFQYSGSEQDFTNPLTYTVRYTDHENNVTLTQDWIVTVTNKESPSGPYTVKSNYLKNPDLAKSLVSDWADFWKTAYDTEYGGFFSYVNREGNPTDDIKTMISQTQNAYAFARAFMVTGDTSYLRYSNGALQFMSNYLWNETIGGWYVSASANGDILEADPGNRKDIFFQHYANLGMVAMADATAAARFGNQEISGNAFIEPIHWEMLNNSLDVINENMWDDRADYYGYYDIADIDWSNPSGKGFSATVDGITTHGLYMYLVTQDPFFYTRLEQLANDIEEHMIPEMESAAIGFPDLYNSNWEVQPGTDGYIGHMFKTAWCLARAYLVNPQERYREAAKKLMFDMLDNGAYDYYYGAPYSACDWSTGYINTTYKLFWETEQAYNSGIMNYYISTDEDDKDRFLEVADGSIDFFMKNFVDTEYGEVYEKTDRGGNPGSLYKGGIDKAGYHSTELAYYTYLYGNLFYKKEPVELYYFINASDKAQTVSLYPLAIEDNYLKIEAVELNGNAFNTYDKDTRKLNIAAHEGGIFKVTFINTKPFTGIDAPDIDYGLDVKVYPNPITSSGIIEYKIDECTDVTINIIDITGKLIHAIENKNISPGIYHEIIYREDFNAPNIYILQVKTNTQSTILKLIIMN